MADNCAYVVAGKRSPVGRYLGSLSKLSAMEVGAQVAKALLAQAKADQAAIDEVFVGQVLQGGCGQNPARQVALGAGIRDAVSCVTVNKVCGSGLQSVMFADQVIRAGDAELILAGGIEAMSQAPFLVRALRTGNKFGHTECADMMLYDGLTNVYSDELMGEIAEYTAEKAGITRRSRTSGPCAVSSSPPKPPRTATSRVRSPRSSCRAARAPSTPTRPSGPTPRSRAWPASSPRSRRTVPSPPATPPSFPTAAAWCSSPARRG